MAATVITSAPQRWKGEGVEREGKRVVSQRYHRLGTIYVYSQPIYFLKSIFYLTT